MKKWVFILIVLFAGVVSAQCASDDVILKMSDKTNAHVSLWDDANYNVEVCYSNLFGGRYIGPNAKKVHTCDGKNDVVWLAQLHNSHVSVKKSQDYSAGVCYGDLDCTVRSKTCKSDEKEILSLISKTNSHASLPGLAKDYNYKVCCESNSAKQLFGWRNEEGMPIGKAKIGDIVYAFYPMYDGNPDATFDIYERVNQNTKRDIFKDAQGENKEFLGVEGWSYKWEIKRDEIVNGKNYDNFRFMINGKESTPLKVEFCGDGETQDGEECDDGPSNGIMCVPSEGGCDWCNANCKKEHIGFKGKCGDGKVQNKTTGYPFLEEECDLGKNNAKTCKPESGKTECDYCDKDVCKWRHLDYSKNLYWTDLIGNRIASSFPEMPVLMNYKPSSGKCIAKSPLFSIYDKDGSKDVLIQGKISSKCQKNTHVARWDIPKIEDLALKTTGRKNDFSDLKDIFFKADGKESAFLQIDFVRKKGRPKIEKLSVKCGEEIKKGEKKMINFYLDSGRAIVGSIFINGKNVYDIKSPGSQSFSYTFDDVGTNQMAFYLEDSISKEKYSYFVNLIVYDLKVDGEYIAPCIKEPGLSSSGVSVGFVYFDASNTKAIKISGGKKTSMGLDKLKFHWKFSDGTTSPYESGKDSISYQFHKYFQDSGENWAELSVEKA